MRPREDEAADPRVIYQTPPDRTSEGDDSDVPATSTAGSTQIRSPSFSSSANLLVTSFKTENITRAASKAPIKKLSRPKPRTRAAKFPRMLTLAASRSHVTFEQNHQLTEGSASKIPRRPGWTGKKDTILTRLAATQKKQRAEQSNKSYKDLQKEGKFGIGPLY